MREYMKRWREEHPDYWRSERQKEYLRRWREKHPDYFRRYAARAQKQKSTPSRRARERRETPD
jgi:hypothetical protein